MIYALTGFKQDLGFRVFSFERTGAEPRSTATVRANLDLARKHGILAQELPLLCREVLDHAPQTGSVTNLTYSEDAMLACIGARRAQRELAARKKLHPPPAPTALA
ncbi:MAG: hypothetical protein ACRD01_06915 [Terriglobales bacterium]